MWPCRPTATHLALPLSSCRAAAARALRSIAASHGQMERAETAYGRLAGV